MGFVFHHGVAIPLWALVLGALALSWVPTPHPAATAMIVIAAAASVVIVMARRLSNGRPTVGVLPVMRPDMSQRGAPQPIDVLELVRMGDGGTWRLPSQPSSLRSQSAATTEYHNDTRS